MLNKVLLLGNLGLTAYNLFDRNRDQKNLFEESLILRKSATNKLINKLEELKNQEASQVDIQELQKLLEGHIKATAQNNEQKKSLGIDYEDSAFLYAYAHSTAISKLMMAADDIIRENIEGDSKVQKLLEGFEKYREEVEKYSKAIQKLGVFLNDPDNAHLYFTGIVTNA